MVHVDSLKRPVLHLRLPGAPLALCGYGGRTYDYLRPGETPSGGAIQLCVACEDRITTRAPVLSYDKTVVVSVLKAVIEQLELGPTSDTHVKRALLLAKNAYEQLSDVVELGER